MQTKLHHYRFDISKEGQARAYDELCERLRSTPGRGRWLHVLGQSHDPTPHGTVEIVELDASYLFDNQWNTKDPDNRRLFDWYEAIWPNKNIKQGHYLEITDSMRGARRNTNKCGYCGAHEPAQKGYVFCPHCIESPYLNEGDLYLTRMTPVDRQKEKRAPLTEAERAHLLPQYIQAQIHGKTERGKARAAKQRADLARELSRKLEAAQTKHDGFLWLLDNGVKTDNVIYYSHTDRFAFGWRRPIGDDEYSALVDTLCEFPFDYDIKREASAAGKS